MGDLAEWDDPQVQLVYGILSNSPMPPNPEEHWEGYQARLIVDALRALPSATQAGGWMPPDIDAIRHHERFGPLDEHGNPLDPRRRG